MENFLNTAAAILFFILGSIIGSFLNVLIYRLPKKESIVKGRSHCTYCGKQILNMDLIPIISYIIQLLSFNFVLHTFHFPAIPDHLYCTTAKFTITFYRNSSEISIRRNHPDTYPGSSSSENMVTSYIGGILFYTPLQKITLIK